MAAQAAALERLVADGRHSQALDAALAIPPGTVAMAVTEAGTASRREGGWLAESQSRMQTTGLLAAMAEHAMRSTGLDPSSTRDRKTYQSTIRRLALDWREGRHDEVLAALDCRHPGDTAWLLKQLADPAAEAAGAGLAFQQALLARAAATYRADTPALKLP